MAIAIAIGTTLGAAAGSILFEDTAIGIAVGVALGAAAGSVVKRRR